MSEAQPITIAVAGGFGFIGRHVVQRLRSAGCRVRVVSRSAHEPSDGIEAVACDVGQGPIDPVVFEGCEAVVNLVGIAGAHGSNTFERAHVDAVRHLLEAAESANVRRFVHVSVTDVPGARGPYAETKRRGEQLVGQSALDWIVLRPALVVGEGDQALRNLVTSVRAAPLVPVPAGETGPLAVIDVEDVADAIDLAAREGRGKRQMIDLVGPQGLTMRQLVTRVGEALALPTRPLGVPQWAIRLAAAVFERLLPRPPLTSAQVEMLIGGLHGDAEPANRAFDLQPQPLRAERIAAIAKTVPPPPIRARLITSADHRAWLESFAAAWRPSLAVAAAALALLLALPHWIGSVWPRMAIANAVLVVLVGLTMSQLPWSKLWKPSWSGLLTGAIAAAVMVGGSVLAVSALRAWAPDFTAGADDVYAWATLVSPPLAAVGLVAIAAAEDWVWRGAITLPLAASVGPVVGCLAAGALFGLAHWTSGPPVLALAALLAGSAWSLLAVRTRSLFVAASCHVLWDACVLALSP